MSRPILYSFRRCPYAMRARLALAVSGIEYELREVKLSDTPAAMLAASPKGTVPVLVMPDGTVIEESIDIMRWALGVCDPEEWRARDDPALIAANDGGFKRDLDRYKYPERYGSDPVAHRAAGLSFVEALERRLAGGGHLCGARRGLADAAILPFVRQFASVERDWFERQPVPRVRAWLAEHLASDLFATIMQRQPRWVP